MNWRIGVIIFVMWAIAWNVEKDVRYGVIECGFAIWLVILTQRIDRLKEQLERPLTKINDQKIFVIKDATSLLDKETQRKVAEELRDCHEGIPGFYMKGGKAYKFGSTPFAANVELDEDDDD